MKFFCMIPISTLKLNISTSFGMLSYIIFNGKDETTETFIFLLINSFIITDDLERCPIMVI
jgi:hypothetical protein